MLLASNFKSRVGEIARFVAPNLPLKSALSAAAKFTGLGHRRVRALWAGEARRIDLRDQEAIEAAEAEISEHFLTKEVIKHAYRLERHVAKLAAECPETHRSRIHKLRDLVGRVRGLLDREGA